MNLKRILAAGSVVCSVSLGVATTAPPAQASLAQPVVVSANPADSTPHIILNPTGQSVYAYAQVGRTMYAGGRFAQVQNPARTITYTRQNFVAFDAETGVISPLNLAFDGIVEVIISSPDGTSLYIGGSFKTVNGVARRAIIKYNLATNQIDPTFNPPLSAASVGDARLVNGRLIVAGSFTKHLVALNPTTGADTGYINLNVGGYTNPGDVTRVRRIAISPDGTRLVATGNFSTVNGLPRKRAFEVNMGSTIALSTWHAARFDVNCASTITLVTAQGVDFSPDGSYFVIVAVGGPSGTTGLCDAAARFETSNVSATAEPTWINWTGGDSLWSVAVTGAAVYVGGHNRWLDNPLGHDSAGPGAVSRPGIGALDPLTGQALSWNPTHSRNHGVTDLLATPCGLWAGSDGEQFGGEDHAGIGFVPLTDSAPTQVAPYSCVDTFVNQQYLDFVHRLPTPAENGATVAAITDNTKSADQVIDQISHLAMVQQQAPIIRLYRSYLRRLPDMGGLDFYTSQYRSGAKSLSQISTAFAASSEFAHTYGALNNTQFVQLVYQNVLGRTASANETTYWVTKLNSGYARSQMMLFFSESSEDQNKTRNTVDVVITYRGMLQRMPTATEQADGEAGITTYGLDGFIDSVRLSPASAARFN